MTNEPEPWIKEALDYAAVLRHEGCSGRLADLLERVAKEAHDYRVKWLDLWELQDRAKRGEVCE